MRDLLSQATSSTSRSDFRSICIEVSSLSPSPLRFSLSSVCHLLLSAWLSDCWCWFFPATPPSLGLELARSRKRSLFCLWLREMRADVPVWAWFLHCVEVCVLIEGRFLCTFQTLTLCVCVCVYSTVWVIRSGPYQQQTENHTEPDPGEPHWYGKTASRSSSFTFSSVHSFTSVHYLIVCLIFWHTISRLCPPILMHLFSLNVAPLTFWPSILSVLTMLYVWSHCLESPQPVSQHALWVIIIWPVVTQTRVHLPLFKWAGQDGYVCYSIRAL